MSFHTGCCGSTAIDDDGAVVEFTLDDTKDDGSHPALMGWGASNQELAIAVDILTI